MPLIILNCFFKKLIFWIFFASLQMSNVSTYFNHSCESNKLHLYGNSALFSIPTIAYKLSKTLILKLYV